LAFSYWIDYLGFVTEGKLAAIFIKPSLGVSNWPVIYFISYTPSNANKTFCGTIHHRAISGVVLAPTQPFEDPYERDIYVGERGAAWRRREERTSKELPHRLCVSPSLGGLIL
jgi:hypothetical protein